MGLFLFLLDDKTKIFYVMTVVGFGSQGVRDGVLGKILGVKLEGEKLAILTDEGLDVGTLAATQQAEAVRYTLDVIFVVFREETFFVRYRN